MSKHQHTPRLQQILEYIWYQNNLFTQLGKYLLSPLSLLFCVLARIKSKTDSTKAPPLPLPVIVVGNINVGGTGKTPLVIYLARLLKHAGYSPCIITRGYKGTASRWPILVNEQTATETCGDEAKLMKLAVNIPVIAGPGRVADIEYAAKHTQANIIISDDGLQHYKMQRDLEIAVVDTQRGLGNTFCLPAGPLRETKKRLHNCDYVVCNGGKSATINNCYVMQLTGADVVNLVTKERKHISELNDIQVITGIGNPQRFITTLKRLGANIIAEHLFADHHRFSKEDFQTGLNSPLVMTEKDAVKCFDMQLNNAWYLPVSARLSAEFDEEFLGKVEKIAAGYRN